VLAEARRQKLASGLVFVPALVRGLGGPATRDAADRDTVPPIIKTNLGGKIALRVASQANSRIILDEGGAEHLLGKGDLLANLGHGVVRAQAPLVG
jgi:hypothetical protein